MVSADTEIFRAIKREMTGRPRALETGDALAERIGRDIRHLLPSRSNGVMAIWRRPQSSWAGCRLSLGVCEKAAVQLLGKQPDD
jgi:hypothetical protein